MKIFALAAVFICGCSGEEGHVLFLEHSLSPDAWDARGSVSVNIDAKKKKLAMAFSTITTALTSEQVNRFSKTLGAGGFYKLRIRKNSNDPWMIAAIPSCLLVATNFREKLRFHFEKSGTLAGFDFVHHERSQDVVCTEKDFTAPHSIVIHSQGTVSMPEKAQSIPLNVAPGSATAGQQSTSQGIPGDVTSEQDDKAQPEPEQGFLRKYWYMFVPIILMQFIQQPAAEEEPDKAVAATKKKN